MHSALPEIYEVFQHSYQKARMKAPPFSSCKRLTEALDKESISSTSQMQVNPENTVRVFKKLRLS